MKEEIVHSEVSARTVMMMKISKMRTGWWNRVKALKNVKNWHVYGYQSRGDFMISTWEQTEAKIEKLLQEHEKEFPR